MAWLFLNDKKKVDWIIKEEKRLSKNAAKMVDDFYRLNLSKLSNRELIKKLDFYIEAYTTVYGLYHLTQPQCFEKFNSDIKSRLRKMGLDEVEVFLELSTPHEPSSIAQEDADCKRMFIAFLKGAKKAPLLAAHLKKYRFMQASEGRKPWTDANLLERFKQNEKDAQTLEKELQEQEESYFKLKQRQEETIKRNRIPLDLQQKFAVLRHFSNSRLIVRYAWTSLVRPYSGTAGEIGNRIGERWPPFGDYRIAEVKDALLKNKRVSPQLLKERYTFGVVLLKNGKISVLSGQKARAFYRKHVPREKTANFVKGMIANKGVKEGTVKVISFQGNIFEQMKAMKRGQILVVGQTRPILMPAIEKASAIVADEGGITSHAAIVSREFNIPCIVGTHNATRIFKDGEKIRVDAHLGIAKKMK